MTNAQHKKPQQLPFSFVASNDNEPLNEREAKFNDFHNQNPHVFKEIEDYALEAIEAGWKHYGIKTLLEIVRWHSDIKAPEKCFKISNNHAPYYARLFHKLHPEFDGFFRTHRVEGEMA